MTMSVCLCVCVCLSASLSLEIHARSLRNLFCMLPTAVMSNRVISICDYGIVAICCLSVCLSQTGIVLKYRNNVAVSFSSVIIELIVRCLVRVGKLSM